MNSSSQTLRLRIVVGLVILSALAISLSLYKIQIHDNHHYLTKATNQNQRTLSFKGPRGAILDSEGRALAISVKSESLYVHPSKLDDTTRSFLQAELPKILGMKSSVIRKKLNSEKPFVWIKRRLGPEVTAKLYAMKNRANEQGLEKFTLNGTGAIGFKSEGLRAYPGGQLAFHVLGGTTIDQDGIAGLELRYHEALTSEPETILSYRGGRKNQSINRTLQQAGNDAADLVLTIDGTLQHIAERELQIALRETGAKAGSIVLMDPRNGDILALANSPTGDSNRFGNSKEEQKRNRAVTDQFEPGSTFKIISAAAALELGKVSPNHRYDCENGSYKVPGGTIRDHKKFKVLSFSEVIEKSSNIGMAKSVERVSKDAFYKLIRDFGFAQPTGIELPAETPGYLAKPAVWSGRSKATISFGHEITVNAIQLTSAIATVANGGVRMAPRLVAGTQDPEQGFIPAKRPQPKRVIRAETARLLTEMLVGVVATGTGTAAAIPGYDVAGKTGTAQKVIDRGYSQTDYVASFGGYAPARSPRIVALVVLDTPKGDRHQGGTVAAPVFKAVVERALHHLRVAPDEPVRLARVESNVGSKPATLTKPVSQQSNLTKPGVMPNVKGLALRDALFLLQDRCVIETSGTGLVRMQSPSSGQTLKTNQKCSLVLTPQLGKL